jgi:ABC-type glycerol-3-phosphate transport system permease component
MFEHHKKPLISREAFYRRMLMSFLWSVIIVFISLSIGILGYHFTENLGWLDSLLNASMILGGMGPVDVLKTPMGKLFASFYALFSGIAFLTTVAVVLAPVLHRFLHKFHLNEK